MQPVRRSPVARAPCGEERAAILGWLDRGLRRGESGRLQAEYPLSLAPGCVGRQRVVFEGGAPASHAMFHVVEVRAAGRALRLGMIGLVYTDERRRGCGLASACVEACVDALARQGVPLAALWSDHHAFYGRLGFRPGGSESLLVVDAEVCRRAADGRERPEEIAPARSGTYAALEDLYARKPVRVLRPRGALEALASAPETELLVASAGGRALGYAACGRGDDFAGVVHEWAGSPSAVLACLEAHAARRGRVGFLAGPLAEAPGPALRAAGAEVHPGCFALLRMLDAAACVERLLPQPPEAVRLAPEGEGVRVGGARGEATLSAGDVQDWLFSGSGPAALQEVLSDRQLRALVRLLPWPLYVWGFDSI